eukprot:5127074-Pleurochrysis_carterae.AAC.7
MKHKALGKTGFVVSQLNRTDYILQLQTLLLETDKDENDLVDGGFCIDYGRSVWRRATGSAARAGVGSPPTRATSGRRSRGRL